MKLDNLPFLINAIRHSRTLRQKLARKSHILFFLLYLSEYITHPTADFQREMFELSEDKDNKLCVISAFRGSAKSTIFSTSLPIWKIISGQSHFVVIASQTQHQSRQHMSNIKKPLETNRLLMNDIGPFHMENTEWGFTSGLIFDQYDAKLMVVSTEQSIRGLRYKHYRPDLIILDDIEDLNSTRTKESRDKIYQWFVSEIIPLGTKNTIIFALGNFLHEYGFVGRLMSQIESGERKGVCRRYPLLDKDGGCLWPGMYPDQKAVAAMKAKVGDEQTWEREFILNLISADDKLVLLSWIHRYDKLPEINCEKNLIYGYQYTWAAADMAISESESADFTSIVTAKVFRNGEDLKIYILPGVINRHVNFPEAVDMMKYHLDSIGERTSAKMFIEANNFQSSYYQQMLYDGYNQVVGIKVSADKRTRLSMITKFIKDGTIVFPKAGADVLVTQLIGFGREHHEDAVDALTMLVSQILKEHNETKGLRLYMKMIGADEKFRPKLNPKDGKWPIIDESDHEKVTYMPHGEKYVESKIEGVGNRYYPPDSNTGTRPAFKKNPDGTYTLKPWMKSNPTIEDLKQSPYIRFNPDGSYIDHKGPDMIIKNEDGTEEEIMYW